VPTSDNAFESAIRVAIAPFAANVIRTLRSLSAADCVDRSPDKNDGRAVVVSLTPKGLGLAKQLKDRRAAFFVRLIQQFPGDETEQLIVTLEKLSKAVQIAAAPPESEA